MRRRRAPETKVPGSPLARGNRAAQNKVSSWPTESTPDKRTPSRPYRRPFPRLPFRRFYGWPAGLAYAVGLTWPAGSREAA